MMRRIFGEAPPKAVWRAIRTREKIPGWLGSDMDPSWMKVEFIAVLIMAGIAGGIDALVRFHIL